MRAVLLTSGSWLGFVLVLAVGLDLVTFVFGKSGRGVGYGVGVIYLFALLGVQALLALALLAWRPEHHRLLILVGSGMSGALTLWLFPGSGWALQAGVAVLVACVFAFWARVVWVLSGARDH